MPVRFADKIILITGGAQGIGAAAAHKFAEQGGTVILTDVLPILLKETSDSIKAIEGRSFYYVMDVAKRNEIDQVVKECIDKFGKIDVLVHCAGIYKKASILDMKESEWDQVINVNLKGTFLVCQAVVREMIKQGKGKIVCLASIAGEKGASSGRSHYGASKGGVLAFCKSLAREIAEYGINVNCIAPGVITTNMTREMIAENRELVISNTPLARIGSAEEVADAILFLSSNESDYITGSTIDVNGGLLMR